MKPCKWDAEFSLCSFTGTSTMQSSCILRILTKEDLKTFKERLHATAAFAWYPTFIAAILIEKRLQDLPAMTQNIRRRVYMHEKGTGVHKSYRRPATKPSVDAVDDNSQDHELQIAPRDYASIASDCAYYESACISRRQLMQWLREFHHTFLKTSDRMQRDNMVSRMTEQKLSFMEMIATERENRMIYLGKRAGIQLQMVRPPSNLHPSCTRHEYSADNIAGQQP
jgi:hypothetical protein